MKKFLIVAFSLSLLVLFASTNVQMQKSVTKVATADQQRDYPILPPV